VGVIKPTDDDDDDDCNRDVNQLIRDSNVSSIVVVVVVVFILVDDRDRDRDGEVVVLCSSCS